MEATNSTKKINLVRYPELDCLRGIAVLAVLLYHYTFAYDYHFGIINEKKFYFHHGNLAVHLFFIISGFVIFMTLLRSKTKIDFLVSRFSRLYPAYWACMILTIIFLIVLPVPTLGHYTAKEILLNITMLQGFTKVRLIDQVYWTLKMELTFYVIMYILYFTNQLNKINLICVIWLLFSITSCFLKIPLKKYIDVLFILEYCPLFIAGICFFKIKQETNNLITQILIPLTFLVECCWLNKHLDENYISQLILAVIYIIFYLFAFDKLSFIKNKILLFFGSISYSLYLTHNVIGYSIIYQLRKFLDHQILYVAIPLLITVLFAYCITTFIEVPSLTFIRNKYKAFQVKQILSRT